VERVEKREGEVKYAPFALLRRMFARISCEQANLGRGGRRRETFGWAWLGMPLHCPRRFALERGTLEIPRGGFLLARK